VTGGARLARIQGVPRRHAGPGFAAGGSGAFLRALVAYEAANKQSTEEEG
jgi:hypothetical protein